MSRIAAAATTMPTSVTNRTFRMAEILPSPLPGDRQGASPRSTGCRGPRPRRPSRAPAGERSARRTRRKECRSEEHTSELQSQSNLVCRLLLEKKKKNIQQQTVHIAIDHHL